MIRPSGYRNGTDWKLRVFKQCVRLAADRWVQKMVTGTGFKADGIMAHSGWLALHVAIGIIEMLVGHDHWLAALE